MRAGFTLLELLVALAILSIGLAAAGAALLSAATPDPASDLINLLRSTRMQALESGQPARVRIDTRGRVRISAPGVVRDVAADLMSGCGDTLVLERPVSFTVSSTGVLVGDTARFSCNGRRRYVAVSALSGKLVHVVE